MRRLAAALLALLSGCASNGDLRGAAEAAGAFSPRRKGVGIEARIELGRLLFFDRELSGNRNVACASCHLPFHHAGDQLALGRGQGAEGLGHERTGGPRLPRNTVEPFNRSFASALFWDGRVEERADGTIAAPVPLPDGIDTVLEAQALLPLLDRDEMRGEPGDVAVDGRPNELAALEGEAAVWAAVMDRLMAIEAYRRLFASVFPDVPEGEHGIVHAARAIAEFEMFLWELTDTRFDDYLGAVGTPPEDGALVGPARRGAALFFGAAGCATCHDGPLLGGGRYANIGVPQLGPGKDAATGLDEGRFLVTGDPADRFAFRVPPLRNVRLTGPYMHDGAYDTIEDAIRHHADPEGMLRGYRGDRLSPDLRDQVHRDPATIDAILATLSPDLAAVPPLSDRDVHDLVSFLSALTSDTERDVFPGAGVPPEVPSGLPVDTVVDGGRR
ncbi:MAG TPA: cytochrome c peroxidase [Sandaracinaceae bacterium LLY-WYZ-13_1]|nr:cytochrome c peroxidase [Sandaracinaceae bacterium LLY-WYZ-13_1]